MPTPKVGLFVTPLKMGSKNRKISKIQIHTEIALVNEIHRNLRQMEALGLYFDFFFEILNFRNFFNVLYVFEHRPDPDFQKLPKI
jgi:hypothetical protein